MTIYTTPESFEDTTPSAGGRLGAGLGAGLGEGLRMLLENKLQRMQQQKATQAASQLGIPPGLPPELQKEYFKQAAQSERLSRLQELLSGAPQAGAPQAGMAEAAAPSGQDALSDEQIQVIGTQDPTLARLLQTQKQEKTKLTEAKARREFERAKPILARADERAEGINVKENALSLMGSAIEEGNLGYFSPDNLAEITGIEGLRTGKGAQFISSGKEFFLGSLKRAGSRPNQWIEKQIQKMLPKIGRSNEANLSVMEALKSELAIEKEQLDIIDRLSQEDEEKLGYVRGNIGQRTRKELKKFGDEEQKRLEKRLREIQKGPQVEEVKTTEVIMIDPQGKRRAVEKKDVKEAKKAGYKLGS